MPPSTPSRPSPCSNKLEKKNPTAACIYVSCDNAHYYWSKAIKEFLRISRLKLINLSPYAPNLNLIERLWKFLKKEVLYNRCYETFGKFRRACEQFVTNPRKYRRELRSSLTDNFEIVG